MTGYKHILIDEPADGVRRITLNRPEKRNALSNALRGELFDAIERADSDADIRVTILRGAGVNFSAGYDLASDLTSDQPFHTAGGFGQWPRHVAEGCFRLWDLAKPVIGQVHGYCLAGGSELAAACDLLYVSEDARIGHPVVRAISPPDVQFYPWMIGMRRSMELMLTGDSLTGREAEGFVRPVRHLLRWRDGTQIPGEAAQSVSQFQLCARGDPSRGADVRSVSAVAAQRGRSAVRARHRYMSRDGALLVESFRSDVCSGNPPSAGSADAGFPALALAS